MRIYRKPRIKELIAFDNNFSDYTIIGVDEAGRGPVAGPVTAGAVCFSQLTDELIEEIKYLDDSKKFSSNPALREDLYNKIKENSINSICTCTVEEIDKYNILQASLMAMHKAVDNVIKQLDTNKPIIILVDGRTAIPQLNLKQEKIIKGDSKSASIAAASILAKVNRDETMLKLALDYPQYDWAHNKGYPTQKHLNSIKELGLCVHHRKSFLKKFLLDQKYHQLNLVKPKRKTRKKAPKNH